MVSAGTGAGLRRAADVAAAPAGAGPATTLTVSTRSTIHSVSARNSGRDVFPPRANQPDARGGGIMAPAFAVERTLGRLGKWLRLMGFDTRMERDFPRGGFPGHVGDRLVLTRTRSVCRTAPGRAVFIAANDVTAQIAEVIRAVGLRESELHPFTRCLRCNEPLETAAREDVLERLPPRTAQLHDEFRRCPACRRVYWKGTHYERMRRLVDSLS